MNLFPFQESAIQEIRDKFLKYIDAPNQTEGKDDPFIQFLRAVTGGGKTPILAGAISEMSLAVAPAPIILWTSKTSAVIGQTLINFDTGGKYHPLIPGFAVKDISEVRIIDLLDTTSRLLVTSTVASFNRLNKDGLRVFTPQDDRGGGISLWDALSHRNNKPLFIVYDEGHNTTDNQIDLLLELNPEAILLASATPKITPRLRDFIRGDPNATETVRKKITTTVETRYVVENELVKSIIKVTDYDNPEEFIIEDMIAQYREAEKLAYAGRIAIQPKCIYVSATNDAGDQGRAFRQRKARPIIIWRTLVEKAHVDPDEIAVYCSLKGNDFPQSFHLVRRFEDLQAGEFKHIIFNLGLQEGWDDPEVYFAYIDKTLRSATEITQIIGRVLRQPHAKRTTHEMLNAAHFFVNCPSDKFKTVIDGIRLEIGTYYNDPDNDYIRIIEQSKTVPEPFPAHEERSIPKLAIKTDAHVVNKMIAELERFPDYGKLAEHAIKSGEQQTSVVAVETGEIKDLKKETQGVGQMVPMGELFRKELLRLAKDAAEALDGALTNTEKFRAEICYNSIAAGAVRELARRIALLYIDFIALEPGIEQFVVPSFQPSSFSYKRFVHALHDAYDGLNKDEEKVARALDELGYPWFRNLPKADGYKIPLPLVNIHTRNFFPDFIVFGKETIWCIEPKGGHLVAAAIRDKLIEDIRINDTQILKVILISKGEFQIVDKALIPVSKNGVTLIKRSGPRARQFIEYYEDYLPCIKNALNE